MLDGQYKAFEIRGAQVISAIVEGTLPAIGGFIRNCKEGSIITIHTLDGEPFLIGLSSAFLYCEDNVFLDSRLIPYLTGELLESADEENILS